MVLCPLFQPLLGRPGNWPWYGSEDGGLGDKKYRYSLASLSAPQRCVGFIRRRIGRGGRSVHNFHTTTSSVVCYSLCCMLQWRTCCRFPLFQVRSQRFKASDWVLSINMSLWFTIFMVIPIVFQQFQGDFRPCINRMGWCPAKGWFQQQ